MNTSLSTTGDPTALHCSLFLSLFFSSNEKAKKEEKERKIVWRFEIFLSISSPLYFFVASLPSRSYYLLEGTGSFFESWNSYHPLESRIRPTILSPSEVASGFAVRVLKKTAKSDEISVIKPRAILCRRDVHVVFGRRRRDANERSADRRRPISWSRVSFRRTTSATIYFANLCRPGLPTSLSCTSRKQFTS